MDRYTLSNALVDDEEGDVDIDDDGVDEGALGVSVGDAESVFQGEDGLNLGLANDDGPAVSFEGEGGEENEAEDGVVGVDDDDDEEDEDEDDGEALLGRVRSRPRPSGSEDSDFDDDIDPLQSSAQKDKSFLMTRRPRRNEVRAATGKYSGAAKPASPAKRSRKDEGDDKHKNSMDCAEDEYNDATGDADADGADGAEDEGVDDDGDDDDEDDDDEDDDDDEEEEEEDESDAERYASLSLDDFPKTFKTGESRPKPNLKNAIPHNALPLPRSHTPMPVGVPDTAGRKDKGPPAKRRKVENGAAEPVVDITTTSNTTATERTISPGTTSPTKGKQPKVITPIQMVRPPPAQLLWSHSQMDDKDVDEFVSKWASVDSRGVGHSLPLCLVVLTECDYDTSLAGICLQSVPHNLIDHRQFDKWTYKEILLFEDAIESHGKRLPALCQSMKDTSKSALDIMDFYYTWKKTERCDRILIQASVSFKRQRLSNRLRHYRGKTSKGTHKSHRRRLASLGASNAMIAAATMKLYASTPISQSQPHQPGYLCKREKKKSATTAATAAATATVATPSSSVTDATASAAMVPDSVESPTVATERQRHALEEHRRLLKEIHSKFVQRAHKNQHRRLHAIMYLERRRLLIETRRKERERKIQKRERELAERRTWEQHQRKAKEDEARRQRLAEERRVRDERVLDKSATSLRAEREARIKMQSEPKQQAYQQMQAQELRKFRAQMQAQQQAHGFQPSMETTHLAPPPLLAAISSRELHQQRLLYQQQLQQHMRVPHSVAANILHQQQMQFQRSHAPQPQPQHQPPSLTSHAPQAIQPRPGSRAYPPPGFPTQSSLQMQQFQQMQMQHQARRQQMPSVAPPDKRSLTLQQQHEFRMRLQQEQQHAMQQHRLVQQREEMLRQQHAQLQQQRHERLQQVEQQRSAAANGKAGGAAATVVPVAAPTVDHQEETLDEAANNAYYEVEKILNYRVKGRERQFLVKWAGYTSEWNTWEPEQNLANNIVFHKFIKVNNLPPPANS